MEGFLVPGAGLEPAQPQWSQDFKSCVSTDSTTRASDAFASPGQTHPANDLVWHLSLAL